MTLHPRAISEIQQEYKKTQSIRAVHRQLGHSLSTIHKYVRQKFPNTTPQQRITAVKTKSELLTGIYVGLWMGDGTQYTDNGAYTTKICSSKTNIELNQFVQKLIKTLFGKKTHTNVHPKKNDLYIRMYSKFIYNYIYAFVAVQESKTHTVQLKQHISNYSEKFLRGVLLGLTLSDGYVKKTLVFRSTSHQLALNFASILEKYGFTPTIRKKVRKQPNWNDITTVRLGIYDTKNIISLLNKTILETGISKMSVQQLKYA